MLSVAGIEPRIQTVKLKQVNGRDPTIDRIVSLHLQRRSRRLTERITPDQWIIAEADHAIQVAVAEGLVERFGSDGIRWVASESEYTSRRLTWAQANRKALRGFVNISRRRPAKETTDDP
jgi:hypothetical protein